MKQFDYLVLGSGIAGLSFALKVATSEVFAETQMALAVFVGNTRLIDNERL